MVHGRGINKREAAATITRCIKNANGLINSGFLLLEKNHKVGTAHLATAIEEYGKALIVVLHFHGLLDQREFKRAFRDHRAKRIFASEYALTGVLYLNGAREVFRLRRVIGRVDYEAVRNRAMYAEHFGPHRLPARQYAADVVCVIRLASTLKWLWGCIKDRKSSHELLEPVDLNEVRRGAKYATLAMLIHPLKTLPRAP